MIQDKREEKNLIVILADIKCNLSKSINTDLIRLQYLKKFASLMVYPDISRNKLSEEIIPTLQIISESKYFKNILIIYSGHGSFKLFNRVPVMNINHKKIQISEIVNVLDGFENINVLFDACTVLDTIITNPIMFKKNLNINILCRTQNNITLCNNLVGGEIIDKFLSYIKLNNNRYEFNQHLIEKAFYSVGYTINKRYKFYSSYLNIIRENYIQMSKKFELKLFIIICKKIQMREKFSEGSKEYHKINTSINNLI